jgi:hypothetical protein
MSIEFSPIFRGTGASPVQKNSPPHGRGTRATRKPVSPRRLAANRANARKSTGPRSAAGKRRVARNALKHGLCARYGSRLPSECDATFEIFVREIEEDLRPTTTMQRVLFPQIANLLWRLERLPQAQADIFIEELPKAAHDDKGRKRGSGGGGGGGADGAGETLTPAQVLARRFSDDKSNGFILLDRYERSMRNALLRLLKQFDALAKRSRALDEADPDQRVPREQDKPAWTMEKQQHQEAAFARREEELPLHVPPRDEYEAALDLTIWRCAQARRLAEQRELVAEQTQSNPTENRDGDAPEGKCPTLRHAPATEQTHSPPHLVTLSPCHDSHKFVPPTFQKGPRDA